MAEIPTFQPGHDGSRQFNPASWEIVPPGQYQIHGVHAVNRDVSKEEAARRVKPLNHPAFIEQNFVNAADHVIRLDEGRVVAVNEPTGKYSPNSVLVTAVDIPDRYANPGLTKNDEYDRDHLALYNQTVISLLLAMQQNVPEDLAGKMRIFSTENAVSHRTNETYRTSRTIDDKHAQISAFDPDDFIAVAPAEEPTPEQEALAQEQAILQRTRQMERFIARLRSEMDPSGEAPQMGVRTAAPFGYYIEVPMDPYDIAQNNDNALYNFTDLVSAHYQAYKKVASRYEGYAKKHIEEIKNNPTALIPTSFREYRGLTPDGRLIIVISPEFWSPSGVIEALQIEFKRGEEFPVRTPHVSKKVLYDTAAQLMNIDELRCKAS